MVESNRATTFKQSGKTSAPIDLMLGTDRAAAGRINVVTEEEAGGFTVAQAQSIPEVMPCGGRRDR